MAKLTVTDYLTSLVAATSFIMGATLGIVILSTVVGLATHNKDLGMAGIVFAPLILISAFVGAWGLPYLTLRFFFRLSGQGSSTKTYHVFAYVVLLALVPVFLIGIKTSRSFVTVPVFFLSLAATYLLARYQTRK